MLALSALFSVIFLHLNISKMKFVGINKSFFNSYFDAFSYLPEARKNIKSDLYTSKDYYCNELFIGCWLHPFFALGVIIGLFVGLPIWVFAVWFGINILLFHPDIR